MRSGEESGQVMVLAIGLSLVAFAVAGLAVDGTRAFILRRSLQNLADGASVAAAASIDERLYYSSGGSRVRLDGSRADEVAGRVFEDRGIRAKAQILLEGDVVTIVLRSDSPTSLLRLVGVDAIPVAASASATAFPQLVPVVP